MNMNMKRRQVLLPIQLKIEGGGEEICSRSLRQAAVRAGIPVYEYSHHNGCSLIIANTPQALTHVHWSATINILSEGMTPKQNWMVMGKRYKKSKRTKYIKYEPKSGVLEHLYFVRVDYPG